MPIAKTAGKALGKQALRSGLGLAGDVLEGVNVKEAAINNAKTGAARLVKKGKKALKRKRQKGGGIGKAAKHINTTRKIGKAKQKRKPRRKNKDVLGEYLA